MRIIVKPRLAPKVKTYKNPRLPEQEKIARLRYASFESSHMYDSNLETLQMGTTEGGLKTTIQIGRIDSQCSFRKYTILRIFRSTLDGFSNWSNGVYSRPNRSFRHCPRKEEFDYYYGSDYSFQETTRRAEGHHIAKFRGIILFFSALECAGLMQYGADGAERTERYLRAL